MKKNTHPVSGPVRFQDRVTGTTFTIESTLGDPTKPLRTVVVDVSSDSHPAYTGRALDKPAEGRLALFYRRYGR